MEPKLSSSKTYLVDLEPIGRRTQITGNQTILDAAQAAGVALMAICGGDGICAECRVRLEKGKLTPLSLVEEEMLTPEERQSGLRLACQAYPLSDVKIEVPPESLTAPQRLQVEGQEGELDLDPPVVSFDLPKLKAPGLYDLRADSVRLREAMAGAGCAEAHLGLAASAYFSDQVRKLDWSVRLGMRGNQVVAVVPKGAGLLGLAVDVGTTKLAAYLVDLASGKTLAKTGMMNPQIAYGEDVVSRIAYVTDPDHDPYVLQSRLVETLNQIVGDLCREVNVSPEQVAEAVLVGNTAMHHLLAGLPVKSLGEAPYVASVSEPIEFPAAQIGLKIAPDAWCYLPPNIAGYVGADHVAMLLATDAWRSHEATVALDIGTNTEISLTSDGKLYTCSCASGPAFEGAHISAGMRAAPGAIERVEYLHQKFHISTIDHQLPVGICGSGILDAVAQLLEAGVIDRRGVLRKESEGVVSTPHGPGFLLVPAEASGSGKEIWVTRKDVNEIQLAKSAIRAGVEVLLIEAGLKAEDIRHFIVAGAFGTYLYLPNAVKIGMFPHLPLGRFEQVGNAAGIGAKMMLISRRTRQKAQEILKLVSYVELTTHPAFVDEYMKAMALE